MLTETSYLNILATTVQIMPNFFTFLSRTGLKPLNRICYGPRGDLNRHRLSVFTSFLSSLNPLQVRTNFQKKLLMVELSWMNTDAQTEVNMFLRATEMNPSQISLGGFFDVNRTLFKSVSNHSNRQFSSFIIIITITSASNRPL